MTTRGKRRKAPRQRSRWLLSGAGVAAAVALLSVLTVAFSGPDTSEPSIAAPDVTLATLGGPLRVSDLEGEVALLYFSFPG